MTHRADNINAFALSVCVAELCVCFSAERLPSDSYTNDLREAAVQRTNVSTASHTLSVL